MARRVVLEADADADGDDGDEGEGVVVARAAPGDAADDGLPGAAAPRLGRRVVAAAARAAVAVERGPARALGVAVPAAEGPAARRHRVVRDVPAHARAAQRVRDLARREDLLAVAAAVVAHEVGGLDGRGGDGGGDGRERARGVVVAGGGGGAGRAVRADGVRPRGRVVADDGADVERRVVVARGGAAAGKLDDGAVGEPVGVDLAPRREVRERDGLDGAVAELEAERAVLDGEDRGGEGLVAAAPVGLDGVAGEPVAARRRRGGGGGGGAVEAAVAVRVDDAAAPAHLAADVVELEADAEKGQVAAAAAEERREDGARLLREAIGPVAQLVLERHRGGGHVGPRVAVGDAGHGGPLPGAARGLALRVVARRGRAAVVAVVVAAVARAAAVRAPALLLLLLQLLLAALVADGDEGEALVELVVVVARRHLDLGARLVVRRLLELVALVALRREERRARGRGAEVVLAAVLAVGDGDGARRRVDALGERVGEREPLARAADGLEAERLERAEEAGARVALVAARGAVEGGGLLGDEGHGARERPRLEAERLDRAERGREVRAARARRAARAVVVLGDGDDGDVARREAERDGGLERARELVAERDGLALAVVARRDAREVVRVGGPDVAPPLRGGEEAAAVPPVVDVVLADEDGAVAVVDEALAALREPQAVVAEAPARGRPAVAVGEAPPDRLGLKGRVEGVEGVAVAQAVRRAARGVVAVEARRGREVEGLRAVGREEPGDAPQPAVEAPADGVLAEEEPPRLLEVAADLVEVRVERPVLLAAVVDEYRLPRGDVPRRHDVGAPALAEHALVEAHVGPRRVVGRRLARGERGAGPAPVVDEAPDGGRVREGQEHGPRRLAELPEVAPPRDLLVGRHVERARGVRRVDDDAAVGHAVADEDGGRRVDLQLADQGRRRVRDDARRAERQHVADLVGRGRRGRGGRRRVRLGELARALDGADDVVEVAPRALRRGGVVDRARRGFVDRGFVDRGRRGGINREFVHRGRRGGVTRGRRGFDDRGRRGFVDGGRRGFDDRGRRGFVARGLVVQLALKGEVARVVVVEDGGAKDEARRDARDVVRERRPRPRRLPVAAHVDALDAARGLERGVRVAVLEAPQEAVDAVEDAREAGDGAVVEGHLRAEARVRLAEDAERAVEHLAEDEGVRGELQERKRGSAGPLALARDEELGLRALGVAARVAAAAPREVVPECGQKPPQLRAARSRRALGPHLGRHLGRPRRLGRRAPRAAAPASTLGIGIGRDAVARRGAPRRGPGRDARRRRGLLAFHALARRRQRAGRGRRGPPRGPRFRRARVDEELVELVLRQLVLGGPRAGSIPEALWSDPPPPLLWVSRRGRRSSALDAPSLRRGRTQHDPVQRRPARYFRSRARGGAPPGAPRGTPADALFFRRPRPEGPNERHPGVNRLRRRRRRARLGWRHRFRDDRLHRLHGGPSARGLSDAAAPPP